MFKFETSTSRSAGRLVMMMFCWSAWAGGAALPAAASAGSMPEVSSRPLQGAAAVPKKLLPGAFYAHGSRDRRALALSFDDGPGASTPEVLAILERHGIKATFFVNGMHVKQQPQLVAAIHNAGHEVADHTYNHVNFYAYEKSHGLAKTEQRIQKEMTTSRQAIFDAIAVYPRLLRMPHGYHRQWLGKIAAAHNYTLVNWSFGADWQNMSSAAMAKDYEAHVQPGAILLFHDGGSKKQKMLGFLEQVITSAKQRNFTLATVSELLEGRAAAASSPAP